MNKSLLAASLSLLSSSAFSSDLDFDMDNYVPQHTYSLRPSDESTSLSWALKNSEQPKLTASEILALPAKFDFSDQMPAIHDQGVLGSCTAQAVTISMEYQLKQQNNAQELSPLFLYYNERKLMGTIKDDTGASLSDGIKAISTWGVCRESEWTYSDDLKKFKVKPSKAAYADAQNYMGLDGIHTSYVSYSLESIKSQLSKGIPVVFGIYVYPSFESAKTSMTGKVPLPSAKERPLGGHALMFTGYNDETQEFKFANSWGKKWGDNGFGYLKYDYIMNVGANSRYPYFYANDIWSIDKVGKEDLLSVGDESPREDVA